MPASDEQPWSGLHHLGRNYDAGRAVSTFEYFFENIRPNLVEIPALPTIENLSNGWLSGRIMIRYAVRAEMHFRFAVGRHYVEIKEGAFGFVLMRDDLESMIYFMRRAVDQIVQSYCLKFSEVKNKIDVPTIGAALGLRRNGSDKHPELQDILFGNSSDKISDDSGFLDVLDEISNSYKHGFLTSESDNYRSIEYPNIVIFDYKYNKFDTVPVIHNHNAFHLMMGFQDAIRRILKNAEALPVAWSGAQRAI